MTTSKGHVISSHCFSSWVEETIGQLQGVSPPESQEWLPKKAQWKHLEPVVLLSRHPHPHTYIHSLDSCENVSPTHVTSPLEPKTKQPRKRQTISVVLHNDNSISSFQVHYSVKDAYPPPLPASPALPPRALSLPWGATGSGTCWLRGWRDCRVGVLKNQWKTTWAISSDEAKAVRETWFPLKPPQSHEGFLTDQANAAAGSHACLIASGG